MAAATGQSSQSNKQNPAAQYSFQYDVADPFTGDAKSQTESRDGDVVRGQYTVNDPDGTTRIVDYSSDPVNGFKVSINRQPNGAAPYVPASPYSRYAPYGASPYGPSPYGHSPYPYGGYPPYAYGGYPQPAPAAYRAAPSQSAANGAASSSPAAASQPSAVGVGAGASSTVSGGAPAPAPAPLPVYTPPPVPPVPAAPAYYPKFLPYAAYDPFYDYGYPFPYSYGYPRFYRSTKK